MDSNHRRRKSTDLQSVAFGRSAIYPNKKNGAGGRNRTNNRLITSQMRYRCATPAYIDKLISMILTSMLLIHFQLKPVSIFSIEQGK